MNEIVQMKMKLYESTLKTIAQKLDNYKLSSHAPLQLQLFLKELKHVVEQVVFIKSNQPISIPSDHFQLHSPNSEYRYLRR
jgi:hypothetical protein